MLGPVSPPSPWVDTDGRLDTLTALLSRTFRPEQRAIVKATSFTREIARRLIPPASHTLFLFAPPEHYPEHILAGANSRHPPQDGRPSRLQRHSEPPSVG